MRILQVNTADMGGGAEGSARALFQAYRGRGHESWLAVGARESDDPDVFEIPVQPAPTAWGRLLQRTAQVLRARRTRLRGARRLARWLDTVAVPARRRNRREGREDFHFPGSHRLLELPPAVPDIVHCHNLHGWYFDLRFLAELSHRVPVVLNLRDAWLLTGHCAYFLDCDHWRHGCGQCPYLDVYPALRRDRTAENLQRKASIYAAGRFYVTAPSRWLLDCARGSVLRAEDDRLIPNGIDLDVFTPGDPEEARAALGIPGDAAVVMVAAARRSPFKDPETLEAAMAELVRRVHGPRRLVLLRLGAPFRLECGPNSSVHHLSFQRDPGVVASCYRAADVFVHTARAEAFGKTVTEAMACGTPVVATAVGGLAEQVIDGETGYLVPLADAAAVVDAVQTLLRDDSRRRAMAAASAERGAQFGLQRQVSAFLQWYSEIIEARRGESGATSRDSTS